MMKVKTKYRVLGMWIGEKKKYAICEYDPETFEYKNIADLKYEFENVDDAIKEAEQMNRRNKREKKTV